MRRKPQIRTPSFDRSQLQRAIVVTVAIKIAGIVLLFDRTGDQSFDLPKSLFSRGAEWVLLALLAVALYRFGPAILPRSPVHWGVAAFVFANVLAAVFAEDRYIALFGDRDRYLGLTFVGDMAVLYTAIAVAFRRIGDWTTLFTTVAVAGAISIAYGVAQWLGRDPIPWDFDTRSRPFGTFGHPDMFGQFLVLAFAGAAGLGMAAAGRRRRGLIIASVIAGVVLVGAMGIVATRGSALGIAATLAVVPLVGLRLHRIPRPAVPWVASASVTVVALIIVAVLVSPLGTRLRSTAQGVAVEDRLVIYENALSAIRDRPILGWGPDGFAVAYPGYRQERETTLHGIAAKRHASAHNWILNAAATTGLVGTAALVALLLLAAASLWRAIPTARPVAAALFLGSAAYWAHGLVTVGSISVDWFPWVAFGGASALTTADSPITEVRRMPRASQTVVAGIAVVAILTGSAAYRANSEARAGLIAWNGGDAANAVARAQAAVQLDSGRVRYWTMLGAARELAGDRKGAVDAYTEATRRAPHISSAWWDLAMAHMRRATAGEDRLDGSVAAYDAARRAVAIDPNEPWTHAVLGQVASTFGDNDLAFREITRAIALYREEPRFDTIAREIALRAPNAAAAREFLAMVGAYKESATLRLATAQVAMKLGDRDAARENARRAVQLDPTNADAQALLRQLGG